MKNYSNNIGTEQMADDDDFLVYFSEKFLLNTVEALLDVNKTLENNKVYCKNW